jgi:hypothetical protein
MTEIKALNHTQGSSGGGVKKAATSNNIFDGVALVSEEAFTQVQECITKPGGPTQANRRGAQLLRKLYKKNR